MSTTTGELRLHVGANGTPESQIWFLWRGRRMAYSMEPAAFVAQPWVQGASAVRLLGTIENAPLIEALYRSRHAHGKPISIQLGSPVACLHDDERVSASMIFDRMDVLDCLRPSVGGWHELTYRDHISYALAREIYASKGRCSASAARLLTAHPAWPAVSFPATHNETRAALLLALLLDPRWYVDPSRPNRFARLKSAFGLGGGKGLSAALALFQLILDDGLDRAPVAIANKAAKAQTVLDTWAGAERDLEPQDAVRNPRNFFWLIAHQSKRGMKSARGLLRASHAFLRLVSQYWQSEICAVPRPDLFVPEHFFQDSAVVDAWHAHCRECQQKRETYGP